MKSYPIAQLCEDVADELRKYRLNLPLITTTLADFVMARRASGWRVCANWSPRRAVKRVRRSLHRKFL